MSRVSSGGALRQGHLRKLKTMKRKYFVLRPETPDCGARLEYYESEKKFRSGAAPRRVLSLKSCFNIARRLDLKQRYVIALYLKEECFCVVPDGDDELRLWLTDLLAAHRAHDGSEEPLQPTQHVWQVNVQRKGLGATKNILGLYNLCLTDKMLQLVKVRPNNNISCDTTIPDKIEYTLKNIRRCGDSECFFYMEVGRQTSTGPGELWMLTEDANIAQSMHSTIYHAMTNCTKEKDDKDLQPTGRLRSVSATDDPRHGGGRRHHGYDKSRLPSTFEKGLCMGACIRQCVCASATYSIDESAAAIAPLSPKSATNENVPPNNTLIIEPKLDGKENNCRTIKHHRTFSLPTGCVPFHEPLKIAHERTRSAPLTGDEVDRLTIEKIARHSYKTVNGSDFKKHAQWNRRDSTGARFPKSSPGHSKNMPTIRNRCESMPSRTCPPLDLDRTPSRLQANHHDDSRDEPDAVDWHPTPGIPEEPDDISYCKMTPSDINISSRLPLHHSRNSSLVEECGSPGSYVPMLPGGLDLQRALSPAASSGSVCSGTPSTDPRFSEYQLEPVTSHIVDEEARPARTYSVGSRPTPAPAVRDRAYSVGARRARPTPGLASGSAPLLPRPSSDDLMELDFSNNSPKTKVIVARTPPSVGFVAPRPVRPRAPDEYVDMSPRAGYVEMRPLDVLAPLAAMTLARSPPARGPSRSPPVATSAAPDGYVEMNYSAKKETMPPPPRPSALTDLSPASPAAPSPVTPVDDPRKKWNTSLGSQTLFPLSLESPASDDHEMEDEIPHHPLTTVREISEEGRKSPEPSTSPLYVSLAVTASRPIPAPLKTTPACVELSCNPTATKQLARATGDPGVSGATLVRAGGGPLTRFTLTEGPPPSPPLNYASLELEPRGVPANPPPRTYTQIDFARSEKLHAADGN